MQIFGQRLNLGPMARSNHSTRLQPDASCKHGQLLPLATTSIRSPAEIVLLKPSSYTPPRPLQIVGGITGPLNTASNLLEDRRHHNALYPEADCFLLFEMGKSSSDASRRWLKGSRLRWRIFNYFIWRPRWGRWWGFHGRISGR